MVDALKEARRVLLPSGILLDVRPVVAPIVLQLIRAGRPVWAITVESYSAPEDIAAADAAMQYARSRKWFVFQKTLPFHFEIECDNTDELREYAEGRKLRGAQIPYEELEARLRESASAGQTARLRCRRPWMLTSYTAR